MGYLLCCETFWVRTGRAHARPVRTPSGCLEPEQVDRAAVVVVEWRTGEPGAGGDAGREPEPVGPRAVGRGDLARLRPVPAQGVAGALELVRGAGKVDRRPGDGGALGPGGRADHRGAAGQRHRLAEGVALLVGVQDETLAVAGCELGPADPPTAGVDEGVGRAAEFALVRVQRAASRRADQGGAARQSHRVPEQVPSLAVRRAELGPLGEPGAGLDKDVGGPWADRRVPRRA